MDAPALVAHNAHIDIGVLRRKLGGWECPEVFDTLKLARRASYRLDALIEEFSLANGLEGVPHRAAYDAVVTARLFALIVGQRTLAEVRDQPSGNDELALF